MFTYISYISAPYIYISTHVAQHNQETPRWMLGFSQHIATNPPPNFGLGIPGFSCKPDMMFTNFPIIHSYMDIMVIPKWLLSNIVELDILDIMDFCYGLLLGGSSHVHRVGGLQPWFCWWDKWGQCPLTTRVITHLRFVGMNQQVFSLHSPDMMGCPILFSQSITIESLWKITIRSRFFPDKRSTAAVFHV